MVDLQAIKKNPVVYVFQMTDEFLSLHIVITPRWQYGKLRTQTIMLVLPI